MFLCVVFLLLLSVFFAVWLWFICSWLSLNLLFVEDCWASWICMSSNKFGKFPLQIYFPNQLFSFFSWSPVRNVTLFDMFPQVPSGLLLPPILFLCSSNKVIFTDLSSRSLTVSSSFCFWAHPVSFLPHKFIFHFWNFHLIVFHTFCVLCRKQLFPVTSRMFTFITSWSVVIIADLGSSLVILTSRLSVSGLNLLTVFFLNWIDQIVLIFLFQDLLDFILDSWNIVFRDSGFYKNPLEYVDFVVCFVMQSTWED